MKNYVKEYKGYKVPEGATHFTEESDKEYFCFYRLHGSEWEFCVMHRTVFSERCWDSVSKLPKNAIELPEAEQEWVPVVGEYYSIGSGLRGEWKDGMYVGVDSLGAHVFDVEEKFLWRINSISEFVRPLKTQEQKDREAFISMAADAVINGELDGNGKIANLAGAMYDAGARFTEYGK